VPRALSSKPHILFLIALGVYLVVLPALGVYTPSATAMLIGGNYTNVTSDLGACIAAGGTLTLLVHSRKRHRLEEERHRIAKATHELIADLHRHHIGGPPPDGQSTGTD
jgi:predicted phage tail protein